MSSRDVYREAEAKRYEAVQRHRQLEVGDLVLFNHPDRGLVLAEVHDLFPIADRADDPAWSRRLEGLPDHIVRTTMWVTYQPVDGSRGFGMQYRAAWNLPTPFAKSYDIPHWPVCNSCDEPWPCAEHRTVRGGMEAVGKLEAELVVSAELPFRCLEDEAAGWWKAPDGKVTVTSLRTCMRRFGTERGRSMHQSRAWGHKVLDDPDTVLPDDTDPALPGSEETP